MLSVRRERCSHPAICGENDTCVQNAWRQKSYQFNAFSEHEVCILSYFIVQPKYWPLSLVHSFSLLQLINTISHLRWEFACEHEKNSHYLNECRRLRCVYTEKSYQNIFNAVTNASVSVLTLAFSIECNSKYSQCHRTASVPYANRKYLTLCFSYKFNLLLCYHICAYNTMQMHTQVTGDLLNLHDSKEIECMLSLCGNAEYVENAIFMHETTGLFIFLDQWQSGTVVKTADSFFPISQNVFKWELLKILLFKFMQWIYALNNRDITDESYFVTFGIGSKVQFE